MLSVNLTVQLNRSKEIDEIDEIVLGFLWIIESLTIDIDVKCPLIKMLTCFIATTAKKDQKINSIITGLKLTKKLPSKFNVVGVDIGLKNFAYCKLEIGNTKPKIIKWEKFDLHNLYLNSYKPLLDINYDRDNILSENLIDSTRYLSYLSNRAIEEILFPPKLELPSIAIVEHQRTRSTGKTSTLPNVLNNFLLENMIFSSFFTYQQVFNKDKSIQLSMINPVYSQSMAHFWINRFINELTDGKSNKKLLVKHAKSMRNKLVYHWINRSIIDDENSNRYPFILSDQLKSSIQADDTLMKKPFIQVANKPNKLLKYLQLNEENITNFKIDDLIDSLLHGLSYAKYHQSKLKLLDNLEKCVANEDNSKEIINEYLEETRNEQLVLLQDLVEETRIKENVTSKKKKIPIKDEARN